MLCATRGVRGAGLLSLYTLFSPLYPLYPKLTKIESILYSTLIRQFLLQLFQRLSFGFRTTAQEEEESADTDGGVNPERTARAQRGIERGERERQRATACPEGERTSGHCHTTHAVGEDFG